MADTRPLFWQWMDRAGSSYNRNPSNYQVYPPSPVATRQSFMPPTPDNRLDAAVQSQLGSAPAYPPMNGDAVMRSLMAGSGPYSNGSMADARAQEIAYANSMAPQAGSMADARRQEIAYANSQPNPAAQGGSGGAPMPPQRPADVGSKPILYNVDFGDGSPVRQYLAKDGVAPNIPGANIYADNSFNPEAGALAKFIRGAF